jgi:transposase InsO family protein
LQRCCPNGRRVLGKQPRQRINAETVEPTQCANPSPEEPTDESLWATLKRDLNWIYGRRTWTSRDLLRSAVFDYIEGFYNPERIQKRLGYRSPADFQSASVA